MQSHLPASAVPAGPSTASSANGPSTALAGRPAECGETRGQPSPRIPQMPAGRAWRPGADRVALWNGHCNAGSSLGSVGDAESEVRNVSCAREERLPGVLGQTSLTQWIGVRTNPVPADPLQPTPPVSGGRATGSRPVPLALPPACCPPFPSEFPAPVRSPHLPESPRGPCPTPGSTRCRTGGRIVASTKRLESTCPWPA